MKEIFESIENVKATLLNFGDEGEEQFLRIEFSKDNIRDERVFIFEWDNSNHFSIPDKNTQLQHLSYVESKLVEKLYQLQNNGAKK